MFPRSLHRFAATFDAQLLEHIGEVPLDGGRRDPESSRDLLVGQALGEQLEHVEHRVAVEVERPPVVAEGQVDVGDPPVRVVGRAGEGDAERPRVVERLPSPGKRRGPEFRMPDACPSCATPLVERGPFTTELFQRPPQPADEDGRGPTYPAALHAATEGMGAAFEELFEGTATPAQVDKIVNDAIGGGGPFNVMDLTRGNLLNIHCLELMRDAETGSAGR